MALNKWGKGVTLGIKDKIAKCKNALQDAYNCIPNVDFKKIHEIEFELDALLEKDEIYWK